MRKNIGESQLELFPDPEKLPPYTYLLPPGGKVTHCNSCSAEIVWATTPSGSNIPLALSTKRQHNNQWVATSHYRDCEHASGWSKRGKTDG